MLDLWSYLFGGAAGMATTWLFVVRPMRQRLDMLQASLNARMSSPEHWKSAGFEIVQKHCPAQPIDQ